ncbi:phosphatidate cytidylyltransferase [Aestuariibius sp. HNIBRBA575]|uniref:phosphatidate cytidylyltransferase n=1 Tax=Aestuariibius sp. HNIBRBA575 TaxID=3233343 RepID=UPI0034A1BD6B
MSSANWSDLRARVISAIVMVVIGIAAIGFGGLWFTGLVIIVCGLMIWELWNMVRPMGSDAQVFPDKLVFCAYALAVIVTGFFLVSLRSAADGWVLILLLVLIVVTSDVAGYFAGRMLGGPKFWPKISPKKTWSGTIAGWVGAALIGAIFVAILPIGWILVPLTMFVAFAGQLGDIAESAIKRKYGVKDSSNLIPGHGGVLDRFDALIGATLVFAVLMFGV